MKLENSNLFFKIEDFNLNLKIEIWRLQLQLESSSLNSSIETLKFNLNLKIEIWRLQLQLESSSLNSSIETLKFNLKTWNDSCKIEFNFQIGHYWIWDVFHWLVHLKLGFIMKQFYQFYIECQICEQFLFRSKTVLTNHISVSIHYNSLQRVINHFTKDQTRIQRRSNFFLLGRYDLSKDFHQYFSNLQTYYFSLYSQNKNNWEQRQKRIYYYW